ncbi:MAG: hypothetical protein V1803_02600 [Candidatus Roizmanbacteria bacterium]
MKEILDKLRKLSGKTKSKNLVLCLMLISSVFLGSNIFFSQKISFLFFGLINNNRKSVVEFMQKIRQTPVFDQQLKYFENVYGPSLKNDVFTEEFERETKIKKLEQILQKNHQSRDILYSLYLLYKEKSDDLTAEKYLRLAKEVDPNIN